MCQVRFYEEVDDALLKFAVIVARYQDKWVFCIHKQRDTYEVPGGHRELGETILATAKRELCEETGAKDFSIKPICVYSVTGKTRVNDTGEELFGMLYLASISSFGEIHSEMEKIIISDKLVNAWTYPTIQPRLIKEVIKRAKIKTSY